jgi:DNA polymerase sigma
VKIRDAKSGIEVDISFGIRSGIENAEVVLGIFCPLILFSDLQNI